LLNIKKTLENILFVAKKPLTLEELSKIIGIEKDGLPGIIEELKAEYVVRGLQIVEVGGGYQMSTRPEYYEYIDRLLHSPIETTLSPAALETLAIVAYKQPVTRLEIENIRGVISDWVIKKLLEKRMIKEMGRAEGLGRPILYGTTDEFLRHFALKDVSEFRTSIEQQKHE
jgi:segregation and condensation protein B